ncbi:WD40-repeat-containing domain protein [Armillaria luteobubalina]|uniref:WD40-repeat-containing domain protein n=1 Tax=Armillaria luteobubalina TaxID=153913 RepID=A0AA39QPT5_9AGAR|nr:WD40-repeat-containing domain protein [Armillaria luteobubalina]
MADSRYRKFRTLEGHRSAVNCVLFFRNADLLISGGDDRFVRLWNVDTGECLQSLTNEYWGQVTALSLYEPDPANSADTTLLFVGTGRGNVTVFPLSTMGQSFNGYAGVTTNLFSTNDSVESQALDVVNHRFIVGSHQGFVKMFDFVDGNLSANPIWVLEVEDIPRGLIFIGDFHRHVMIHTLYKGELICVKAAAPFEQGEENGRTVQPTHVTSRKLQGSIGSAIISPDGRTLVVHNLYSNHFDVYNPLDAELPSNTLSMSLESAGHLPKQCAFAEDMGRILICGGDRGRVYIFDTASNNLLQTLVHRENLGAIYGIAAASSNDNHYIASAESEGTSLICVWIKATDRYIEVERRRREAQEAQAAQEAEAEKEEQRQREAEAVQKARLDAMASLNRRFFRVLILVSLFVALGAATFLWLLQIGAITIHTPAMFST